MRVRKHDLLFNLQNSVGIKTLLATENFWQSGKVNRYKQKRWGYTG